MLSMQCIVYAADMTPFQRVPSERALVMVLQDKAYIIEEHEGRAIRTVSKAFPAPKKVVTKYYVPLPSFYYQPAGLNLHNLKIRDDYQCQYCGRYGHELEKGEFWTMDHIIPTSRGGLNEWENIVLCCNRCNNYKKDSLPEEVGMVPMKKPRAPRRGELIWKR